MRARTRWGIAAALVTATSLAVSGVLAGSAGADQSAARGHAAATSGQPVRRFNVGAAHSPRLLHQMAPAAAGARAAVLLGAVQGVDVASFQEAPGINWSQVASAGIGFAAIKATEGDYYQNPYALKDLAAAKAAGLATVGYAFAIPNGNGASASPVTQADDAIRYLRTSSAGVPPIMLDIEYNPYGAECYGLTQAAMATWIEKFTVEVKARTGRPAILYTTNDWWQTCVGSAASLGANPLWIANLTSDNSPGTLPGPWSVSGWTYWQYSSQGTVKGINGGTDLDQLNPAKLTLLNPGDQQTQAGAQIQPVQLHSSIAGATFSSTSLPAGLTLSSTGQITGTIAGTLGSKQVTVTATDPATQAKQSASFTWFRHGTLTLASLGDRATSVGRPVGLRLSATDSPSESPVTYSAPVLPRGVTISSSGQLTGWPSKPGSYQVTVYAADRLEAAGSASFTWTVGVAPGSGRDGPVRLGLGGKCLNDNGNRSADGTGASIWRCDGRPAQRWIHAQDASLRIHGKCLTAAAVGSPVRLQPCTSDAGQQWLLVLPTSVVASATGQPTTLYNPGTQQCLTDPRFSTRNGTALAVSACNGFRSQAWTLPSRPVVSGIPGKCLQDSRNRIASGNKIESWNCNGRASQRWTAEPDSTLRLRNHCLTVAASAMIGSRVSLHKCSGSRHQKWQVRSINDGLGAELVNPASGKCLAIPRDSAGNGIWLVIQRCDKSHPGMQWRVQ